MGKELFGTGSCAVLRESTLVEKTPTNVLAHRGFSELVEL